MKRIIVVTILLALTWISSPLRAAQAVPGPASFDILGMKLGMSIAQIEAAIKAHDPALTIGTTKAAIPDQTFGAGKFVQFVEARSPSPTPAEFITVAFTVNQPSRAIYIGRRATFPVGQQPLVDKMVQMLRGKYGPETRSMGSGTIPVSLLTWLFDNTGKLKASEGPASALRCGTGVSYGPPFDLSGPGGLIPGAYSAECSTELEVDFSQSANSNILLGLREELVADSIAVDDIQKLTAQAKSEQEKLRQQQEKKASSVKPSL